MRLGQATEQGLGRSWPGFAKAAQRLYFVSEPPASAVPAVTLDPTTLEPTG